MKRLLLIIALLLIVVGARGRPADRIAFGWGTQPIQITLETYLNHFYPGNWTSWSCPGVPGSGVAVVDGENVTDKNILFRGELLPGQDIQHMFVPWNATIYDVTFRVLHWDEWQQLQERLELRVHPKGPIKQVYDPEGVYPNGSLDH